MQKSLEEKQRQLEMDYIRVSDHETIVNERQNFLQKQHELESAMLSKKYEDEIMKLKINLESEIQRC